MFIHSSVDSLFPAAATSNKTVLELELENFKKQAGCLGFTGEPDYQHDQTKGACSSTARQSVSESVSL